MIGTFMPIAERMPQSDGQSLLLEVRSLKRMTAVNVVKGSDSTFKIVCCRLEMRRTQWVTVFQAVGLGSPEAVEDIWSRLWSCRGILP